MKKIYILVLLTIFTLSCCIFVGCQDDTPQQVDVQSVEIQQRNVALNFGGELTLSAQVLPVDATDKAVAWSLIDTNLDDCLLTNNKFVAGNTAGYAILKATSSNGKSQTMSIVVNQSFSQPTTAIFVTFYLADKVTIVDVVAVVDGKVQPPQNTLWVDEQGQAVDFGTMTIVQNSNFYLKEQQASNELNLTFWYTNGNGQLVQYGEAFSRAVTSEERAQIQSAIEQILQKPIVEWKMETSKDGYVIKMIAVCA